MRVHTGMRVPNGVPERASGNSSKKHTHRLYAEKLKGQVDVEGCKFKVLPKKGKAGAPTRTLPPVLLSSPHLLALGRRRSWSR